MPEITIRTVTPEDIDTLSALEHGYYSEYVWQMSLDLDPREFRTEFRRVRLPRRVMVPYPRHRDMIFQGLDRPLAFLVAELAGQPVAYARVEEKCESFTARVSDLVVSAPMRRQGIASGLLVSVMNFISKRNYHYLILEMQSKNDPAVAMAAKLGFNYSGFMDHYFPNQELALFFSRFVR